MSDDAQDNAAVDMTRAWGPQHVAHYLDVGVKQVMALVSDDGDFPSPAVLGPRTYRWEPGTVVEWLRRRNTDRLPVRASRSSKIVDRV